MGGAEFWFLRFLQAMRRKGEDIHAVVRTGSELDQGLMSDLSYDALPLRTVWDPLSRHEVRRLIRKQQPSIVQTYMGRATRLTHIPEQSGVVHISRLGGYYKLNGYRHAHAWIGNTMGLCDYLLAAGFPSDRVFHIYNFAEPAQDISDNRLAEVKDEYGLHTDDFLLLTPGRFVPVKGHRYLLAALAKLPPEINGRRLRLIMLGDGSLREELRQQAEQLGISDRILWAGWQNEMAPWYHLVDMVVFPSREEETLGNIILEAWAYQKPLVTTLFRGAREITTHGQNAWCVPCDDAFALSNGIQTVAQDADLQQSLVVAGSDRLKRNFSEQAVMAQYSELYQQLSRT